MQGYIILNTCYKIAHYSKWEFTVPAIQTIMRNEYGCFHAFTGRMAVKFLVKFINYLEIIEVLAQHHQLFSLCFVLFSRARIYSNNI